MIVTKKSLPGFILALALILSACSSAASQSDVTAQLAQPTEAMLEEKPTDSMADDHSDQEQMGEAMPEKIPSAMPGDSSKTAMAENQSGSSMAMTEMPAFFALAMTDAASGQSFSLSDFKGKVVLVATMAMWCPLCLRQQKQVKSLHGLLGERDDFISVGLDIDPNENLDDLKGYVTSNGFDWWYSVASLDAAREIGQAYGEQFLNPSSTPMFIIDKEGQVHPLPFGVKSAEDLQKALEPLLNEGM